MSKKSYKLWLDDIRQMPDDFDIWAKTADEAIDILKAGGVTFMSFDHDLGDVISTDGQIVLWEEHEKTGYDVAVWVEESAFHGTLSPFKYVVHSANPIGTRKIHFAMRNAEVYWETSGKTIM